MEVDQSQLVIPNHFSQKNWHTITVKHLPLEVSDLKWKRGSKAAFSQIHHKSPEKSADTCGELCPSLSWSETALLPIASLNGMRGMKGWSLTKMWRTRYVVKFCGNLQSMWKLLHLNLKIRVINYLKKFHLISFQLSTWLKLSHCTIILNVFPGWICEETLVHCESCTRAMKQNGPLSASGGRHLLWHDLLG